MNSKGHNNMKTLDQSASLFLNDQCLVDEVFANAANMNIQNDNTIPLFKSLDSERGYFSMSPPSLIIHHEETSNSLNPQQFSRFYKFITSIKDKKSKNELTLFLFPLFLHTYSDMLQQGDKLEDAYAFGRKHMELFIKHPAYAKPVQELMNIKQYNEMNTNPGVKKLKNMRYVIKIEEKTFSLLEDFFTEGVNFAFLQFIVNKIRLNFTSPIENDEEYECEDEIKLGVNGDNNEDGQKVYKNSVEYKRVLEAIKVLENVRTKVPPLLCWSIQNLDNVSCATINDEATLLLTGTPSGQIHLSKLVLPLASHSMRVPINTVPIATPGCSPTTVRSFKRANCQVTNIYGNKGVVHDVTFVPDSKYLLSVSSDHIMRAYSTDTYTCSMKYSGHERNIWKVECTDRGLAATCSADTTARLWDLEHLNPLRIFVGHRDDVMAVKFHPNSIYLATGSYDKAVRLWNIRDGSSVRLFPEHDAPVVSVAFSPCGKYLASGDVDGEVIINDIAQIRAISRFNTANEPATSLDWSKTGETIAAASTNGTVFLHGWPSNSKLADLEGSNIATYDKTFERILNIKYKKVPCSLPIVLGVPKDVVQETFVVQAETSEQI